MNKHRTKNIILISLIFLFLFNIVFSIPETPIPQVYGLSDQWQISSTNNDAWEKGDGTFTVTGQYDAIRTDSSTGSADYFCAGFMFDDIDISYGATITSANVSFFIESNTYDDIDAWIFGHDVDDSSDFVDNADIIDTRTQTSESVNWDEDGMGELSWNDSPDLTDIIQEIIDRAGWESGNNMTFLFIAEDEETLKQTQCRDYSDSAGSQYAMKLNIAWTEPSTQIFPDHVESEYLVTNSSDTLADDDDYAQIGIDGWIIWDFNESIANVVKIRWEVCGSPTGHGYRLEGSEDLASWNILAQFMDVQITGSPPITADPQNASTRYDSEVIGRFRYLRITMIKGGGNYYYVDFICVDIEPSINYDVGSYQYAWKLKYYNWGVDSDAHLSRSYNMLGQEMGNTTYYPEDTFGRIVNSDYDEDNWGEFTFVTFYDITELSVRVSHATSGMNSYYYVSEDAETWTLAGTISGLQVFTDGWEIFSITASKIRYVMITCTGTAYNGISVDAVRLTGTTWTGSGGEGYDWSFHLLPSWLADALGISDLGGQLFASMLILACVLLPFAFYERRSFWATIIVGLVVFAFLVAIGWLPSWLMLVLVLIVTGLFATRVSKWIK